ncbi:hypothetical protein CDAR_545561, partial [Caerostris darwini]
MVTSVDLTARNHVDPKLFTGETVCVEQPLDSEFKFLPPPKKWSLQKHFNEDSLTPAADMNSTVKVLLLIVCVLVYASIVRCASVSKNSIEENQTDIHSIHSNYQLAACKCTGGKCVTENGKEVCKCPPEYGEIEGKCK